MSDGSAEGPASSVDEATLRLETVDVLLDVVRSEANRSLERLAALDARAAVAVGLSGTVLAVVVGQEALKRHGSLAGTSRIAFIVGLIAAVWAYSWRYIPSIAVYALVDDQLDKDELQAKLSLLAVYSDLVSSASVALEQKAYRFTVATWILALATVLLVASIVMEPARKDAAPWPTNATTTQTTVTPSKTTGTPPTATTK